MEYETNFVLNNGKQNLGKFDETNNQLEDLAKTWQQPRGLSLENIIGDISKGVSTRRN